MSASSVRVIAGSAKGHRLAAPAGRRTRPTPDRVREALFSALGDVVDDAVVLDLFAGSGALAIEALSRGAQRAVLVERARPVAQTAADNLARTRLADRARLHRGAVQPFCAEPWGGPFSLVFVDPPYATSSAQVGRLLATLAAAGGLTAGAKVVVERDRRDADLDRLTAGEVFAHERTRTYGDTLVVVLRWTGGGG